MHADNSLIRIRILSVPGLSKYPRWLARKTARENGVATCKLLSDGVWGKNATAAVLGMKNMFDIADWGSGLARGKRQFIAHASLAKREKRIRLTVLLSKNESGECTYRISE
jgi:hypothetical protein